MRAFDPRVTPARADLAAKELEGKVTAARYVEGHAREVVEPQAPLPLRAVSRKRCLRPKRSRANASLIYDTNGEGWAWGQLAADGYVGWLPANALAAPGAPPTHKVAVAADVCLSRSVDQGAASRSAAVRRAPCRHALRSRLRGDPLRRLCAGGASCSDRRIRNRLRCGGGALSRRALSVGRQDHARPRLLGPRASRAEPRAAFRVRATATCRKRRSASRRGRLPICNAAILCSGKAMSPWCATAQASCTPTHFIWRS